MALKDMYPDADAVIAAPLPELASAVLRHLAATLQRHDDCESTHNFLVNMREQYSQREDAALAVSEAWGWLEHRDLICQHPRHGAGWMTVSRLGRRLAKDAEFNRWLQDRELPPDFLHPLIRRDALPLFQQGRFDTAVFEAFKTLEVRIREAARLGHEMIGTKLTARAFNPDDGPLTDKGAEAGERQALQNLMAGAIGSYKNPHSHRSVGVDAAEAREMILLASHLLRIVDARQGGGGS